MTIAFSDRKSGPYTATLGQTVFNYTFPLVAAGDLQVRRLRDGDETVLVLDTDYVVTGIGGASGTFILQSGALAGDQYVALGDRSPYRSTQFPGWRSIAPGAIENELDALTMEVQELRRRLGGVIRRGDFNALPTSDNLILPEPVADKALAWDANGNRLVNVDNAAVSLAAALDAADRAEVAAASSEDHDENALTSKEQSVAAAVIAQNAAETAVAAAETATGAINFSVAAAVATTSISEDALFIRTAGYAVVGDGGAALYKRVVSEPSHAGKLHSVDGGWWEIAESVLVPEMFGGGTAGAQVAVDVASATGRKIVNINRQYVFTSANPTLNMRSGVWVVGVSSAAEFKRENDDLTGILVDFQSNGAHGAKLLRVKVDGNWVDKGFTSSTGMIRVGTANDVEIAWCDIGNCVGAGIRVGDGFRYNIHHNKFRYCQGAQVSLVASANSETAGRVEDNEFRDPTFHAIYNTRHDKCIIRGNKIYGRLLTGMHVTLTSGIITWVSGPTFETIRPGEFVIIHNSSTGGSVECFVHSIDSPTQITTDLNPGYTDQTNQLACAGSGDLINSSAKMAQIQGNFISDGATGGIVVYASEYNSEYCQNTHISENTLIGNGSGAISVQGAAKTQWTNIVGNLIRNPGRRGAIGEAKFAAGVAVHGLEQATLIDGNLMVDDQGSHTMQYGIKSGASAGHTVIGQNDVRGAVNNGVYDAVGTISPSNWGTGPTVSDVQSDGRTISFNVAAGSTPSGTPLLTIETRATCKSNDSVKPIVVLDSNATGETVLGFVSLNPSRTGLIVSWPGKTLTASRVYTITIHL